MTDYANPDQQEQEKPKTQIETAGGPPPPPRKQLWLASSRPMDKPSSVAVAVWSLWFSIVLGVLGTLTMGIQDAMQHIGSTTMYLITVATFAIVAFLNFKISAGINWARIAFAVIFILGCPAMFFCCLSNLIGM